ncbi:MAG: cytochrome c3 family protein [Desulfuromonadia bacterium]
MKKVTVVTVAAAVVALSSASAMAQANNSNIINSRHNLNAVQAGSYNVGNVTSTQICVYCHTPHGARQSVPIWNRNVGVSAAAFTLYSSVTMLNKKHATGFTPDSISLFCMSCHDGSMLGGNMIHNTATFGKFYGVVGTLNDAVIATSARLGADLTQTHPVNFQASLALNTDANNPQRRNDGNPDLNFTDANTMGPVNNATGLTSTKTFPLFASQGQSGYLECSSCHSVHDDYYRPFLRDTMDNSQLCLGCHNK